VNCHIRSTVSYGAEILTLRQVDQKHLGSFEMWCWRRLEKISWTECERSEVLQSVKEERNILKTIKRREANWVGHILRRHCLLGGAGIIYSKVRPQQTTLVRQGVVLGKARTLFFLIRWFYSL
jgi:hypothetical protein